VYSRVWLPFLLLGSAFAATPKPIASIDVATENDAFQKSESRFVLSFPSTDHIAIISTDGRFPARQTAPDEAHLHLRIDFLWLSGNRVQEDGHLEFPTNSENSGAIFLSSGRLLVNDARDLMLFDRDRALIRRKPIEEVCQRSFSKLALLSATLIPGSDKVAVLRINEHFGESWGKIDEWWKYSNVPPKREVVNYEDFCWFSTDSLELLARGGYAPSGEYKPQRDEVVPQLLQTVMTPKGVQKIDSLCDPSKFGFSDRLFILHAREGIAISCEPGQITIQLHGNTRSKKLQKNWPTGIAAEALNAPILLASQSHFRVGLFSFGPAHDQLEVFNYEDMRTLLVLPLRTRSLESSPNVSVLGGSQRKYAVLPLASALSPAGENLAVLDGPTLSVYSLPNKNSTDTRSAVSKK